MTVANRRTVIRTPHDVDGLAHRVLGLGGREQIDRMQTITFSDFAVFGAVRLIDGIEIEGGTNIPDLIRKWQTEDLAHRHAGGRPAVIAPRTMLIVMLMHAIASEELTFTRMSDTIATRLTSEQLLAIGLPAKREDADLWYQRLQKAYKTLVDLVDPYPYGRLNRHKKLDAKKRRQLAKYRATKAVAARSAERQERLDDLMFEINANMVRSARCLISAYNGDMAIDATHVLVQGKHTNPHDDTVDAQSTNLEAGLWVRRGNHNGETGKKSLTKVKFGFEAELVTMTAGENDLPELILGVTLHRPGQIKKVAAQLFPRIQTLGLAAGDLSADRAYSSLKPKDFRILLLQLGYEFVFDYKKTQLGLKHFYVSGGNTYIMVDGSWYLGGMPEALIEATKLRTLPRSDPRRISKATLTERIQAREAYRLIPHGRRDTSGYQRYRLPDPAGYILFDRDDPQRLLPKPTAKTVTIPLSEGIEWAQKYPYLGPAWTKAYNKRSTIERKNGTLKHSRYEDLDNPMKRQFRGHTANAIAISLLVTAHNLRTVDNYLRTIEGINGNRNKRRLTRAPRRRLEAALLGTQKQRDSRRAA